MNHSYRGGSFFFIAISSAAGVAGELCTTKRKEPDMGKRENEGKKEKKQKKERKVKRKQYRGLYLNPISVPRARTCACEGRRIACTCSFAEAGEAAMEIIDNCFGTESRDLRIWSWYCRHFDRRRIVDRAYFYASCQKCGEAGSSLDIPAGGTVKLTLSDGTELTRHVSFGE